MGLLGSCFLLQEILVMEEKQEIESNSDKMGVAVCINGGTFAWDSPETSKGIPQNTTDNASPEKGESSGNNTNLDVKFSKASCEKPVFVNGVKLTNCEREKEIEALEPLKQVNPDDVILREIQDGDWQEETQDVLCDIDLSVKNVIYSG